jgi:hypothetical protein
MTLKTCSGCGASKPLDEFDRAPNSKDGRTSRCKQCRAEVGRIYRKRRAAAERMAEERGNELLARGIDLV